MPRIAVDECPAGPAMDAAVAEALGVEFPTSIEYDDKDEPRYYHGDGMWGDRVAHYSTDIAATWEIMNAAKANLKALCEIIELPNGWFVRFLNPTVSVYAIGETAPLAISRAFLKANGVEYINMENEM